MSGKENFLIKQEGFDPKEQKLWESIMSTGNGELGARGNFEETFSGETLKGTYIGGIYCKDKTRVGWWKNGYPEYFAKIVNCPDFIGIDVEIDGTHIDLSKIVPENFVRELDMSNGVLGRKFDYKAGRGKQFSIESKRFFSYCDSENAVIRYSITAQNSPCHINLTPFINADVSNEESNYGERFFEFVSGESNTQNCVVCVKTKTTDFLISTAFAWELSKKADNIEPKKSSGGLLDGISLSLECETGETITLTKYAAVLTSLNHKVENLNNLAVESANKAKKKGFETLYNENESAWNEIWKTGDIEITGDDEAQKAIRFNIFQLNCSYSGAKSHLNVGPKGFTGEKYGGGVYWDIEAYCIYFYLGTRKPEIARQMLMYRYNQLDKAKENAKKLGLSGALYPMVTMNGEECHNEWEITFEELHRNSAVAFAVKTYTDYTGDEEYIKNYGIDVLCEISRFWASRVNVGANGEYMILGVTGPNEYENNVNNNWYTNRMAKWCFEYTSQTLEKFSQETDFYKDILNRLNLNAEEISKWREIAENMYFPYDAEKNIFLQQDGFLEKEIKPAASLPESERPLNKNWSWDKILRSCYIKQADVLQGLWFLDDCYDLETKKRNFDFYEPLTVHESSLSPSVHAIIACEIGYLEKAYEMFLRTAMLDLKNVNADTDDGLHITSMAGSWMSVVYGFGGIRVKNGALCIDPKIPKEWQNYTFHLIFKGTILKITVNKSLCEIEAVSGEGAEIIYKEKSHSLKTADKLSLNINRSEKCEN